MNQPPAPNKILAFTPGRICLFGEHQDYLGLPVIAAAISLRIQIVGERREDKNVHISLPDISSAVSFNIDETLPYVVDRDYFRSGINVLKKHGFSFSQGIECEVRGNVPINAGTSSSSALTVSWVQLLTQLSDVPQNISPEQAARWAHEAEVLEFDEPGGMMDHFATAFGGVLFIQFHPSVRATPLHPSLGSFVLGDSCETKDTKGILARVKNRVFEATRQLPAVSLELSLHTLRVEDLASHAASLTAEQYSLLRGTIRNRAITHEALALLSLASPSEIQLGSLLNEHQNILRDVLKISTNKINRMIDASLKAGAVGAKINGSGGGGCMFAYAPRNAGQVAKAIEREGGRAYIVTVAAGSSVTMQ